MDTLIGTSAYIPIEVHQDPKHRDVRQDVYACGVMLYQIIVGKLPRLDAYEPVESLRDRFEGIDAVILGATAPEKRRIPTAADLLAEIDGIAHDKKR